MFHLNGFDLQLAARVFESGLLIPAQFCDLFQASAAEHISGHSRGDRQGPRTDLAKRGQIHMVHMGMGEQENINWWKLPGKQRRGDVTLWASGAEAQRNADTIAQGGIGQNMDSVEIDQDSGVPKPADGDLVIWPLGWEWFDWGGED